MSNIRVLGVVTGQQGEPRLRLAKRDGGEWTCVLGQGVDVTAYQLPAELSVTINKDIQPWHVSRVGPPQAQQQRGSGGRTGWRPEPPEKVALVTATGIVKSALEGGHCQTAQDAVSWLQTVYPVALGYAKAATPPATPQAPTQAPAAHPQQQYSAPAPQESFAGPRRNQPVPPPVSGYNEANPPLADDGQYGDIPF